MGGHGGLGGSRMGAVVGRGSSHSGEVPGPVSEGRKEGAGICRSREQYMLPQRSMSPGAARTLKVTTSASGFQRVGVCRGPDVRPDGSPVPSPMVGGGALLHKCCQSARDCPASSKLWGSNGDEVNPEAHK